MPSEAFVRTIRRLSALLDAGDFESPESRALVAAARPFSLLVRAVARLQRGQRGEAWRDVRAASLQAPGVAPVRMVAAHLLFVLGDFRGADGEAAAASLEHARGALLRARQARELGDHRQARAALEGILRGPPPGAGEPAGEVFVAAFAELLGPMPVS